MAERQMNCSISDNAYPSSSTLTPCLIKKFFIPGLMYLLMGYTTDVLFIYSLLALMLSDMYPRPYPLSDKSDLYSLFCFCYVIILQCNILSSIFLVMFSFLSLEYKSILLYHFELLSLK